MLQILRGVAQRFVHAQLNLLKLEMAGLHEGERITRMTWRFDGELHELMTSVSTEIRVLFPHNYLCTLQGKWML